MSDFESKTNLLDLLSRDRQSAIDIIADRVYTELTRDLHSFDSLEKIKLFYGSPRNSGETLDNLTRGLIETIIEEMLDVTDSSNDEDYSTVSSIFDDVCTKVNTLISERAQ